MEPQQALNILDNATMRAPLTRQEHQAVVKALECFAAMIPSGPKVVEDASKN